MIITGGIYKGRKMEAPDEKITRPTLSKVRMGVFNVLYSLMGDFEGKTFLDAFGGSGIMGLEALSRGFNEVFVIEQNPKSAQVIKNNYQKLGLNPNLRIGDSLKLINKIDKRFDVIYIDPPYESDIYKNIFPLVEDKAEYIIAEHSGDLKITNFTLLKTKNYGGKKVSFYIKGKPDKIKSTQ